MSSWSCLKAHCDIYLKARTTVQRPLPKAKAAVHVPLQLGFGFEVTDASGNEPAFLWREEEVLAALDVIGQAQWVSTDVETTGLTDASTPVALGTADIKQGASNVVRMRTIQARVPTVRGRCGPRMNFGFDTDKMGPALTQRVARVILARRMFIAHNAGFDLYWLRRAEGRGTMPKMVVDTMLLTRVLQPKLVLRRAELIAGIRHVDDVSSAAPEVRAAWKSLVSGASGGSLADVVLAMFNVVVDKTFQKPNNWTGLLGFGHYDYAIDDVYWADRIICELLGVDAEGDLLQGYLSHRARKFTVRLIEPQVPELVLLREKGMPVNQSVGRRYVVRQRDVLAKKVDELIELEPTLEAHRAGLADPDAGLSDDLKQCLAAAFVARGVSLRKTPTGQPQVGEKDLRACRAAQMEGSSALFKAWVAVCRSKKTSQMALEVVGFAERSAGSRVRGLLSHGPVTGRLAASEPNTQQWPRDQLFRAMCMSLVKDGCEFFEIVVTEQNKLLVATVTGRDTPVGARTEVESAWMAALFYSDKAVPDWPKEERQALETLIDSQFTHKIVASDFGALDVRVGAALCVRAQREMLDLAAGKAVRNPSQPPTEVADMVLSIVKLLRGSDAVTELAEKADYLKKRVAALERQLEQLKEQLDSGDIARKQFFDRRREVKDKLLVIKLGYRLAQCLSLGAARGETEYSALRDAFVADIDIHTFTGMKLMGRDPMKEFEGFTGAERKAFEKKLKKELGPRRQQGKIANLSLLYGMADAGFQEAAARGYDEHWTMDQAHEIRALWMDAYPEVELWHLWTECLQCGVVYLPEMGKEKPSRTSWFMARTLAGREIVAFGLNAALSYQDQSSGADILGLIMHRLHDEYRPVFDMGINQVHDEQVFETPVETWKETLDVIEMVMVEEANSLTMPYGVPCAVSPALGPLWIKD